MEFKTIEQICEELTLVKINIQTFNEYYIRFHYALIGAQRMKDYQSKKDALDLGYALINATVIGKTDEELEKIRNRKIGIKNTLTDFQIRTR